MDLMSFFLKEVTIFILIQQRLSLNSYEFFSIIHSLRYSHLTTKSNIELLFLSWRHISYRSLSFLFLLLYKNHSRHPSLLNRSHLPSGKGNGSFCSLTFRSETTIRRNTFREIFFTYLFYSKFFSYEGFIKQ